MKPTFTYQDISLVPRSLSKIQSRNKIDLSVSVTSDFQFKLPILPAPMDTISSVEMCRAFAQNGMLGMIHRFQPEKSRLQEFQELHAEGLRAIIAVGLDEMEIISKFYDLGAKWFIVDVANGFNNSVEPIVKKVLQFSDTFVICGNVASKEGFRYLAELGVHAIRVGIGNGSMCTTTLMTGVGQGIVTALQECLETKDSLGLKSLIIADGGITNIGDIPKALGLGADLVMMGRIFAGTKEAAGNVLKYDGKLYKAYRGSASFAVQRKSKNNPVYIEGEETIVQYKGSVQNIFYQIEAGLRSAFSYMGARDIKSFQNNASFVQYRLDPKDFQSK
ncbi:MAG: guanosine monophosphate reductase [Candidatus Marinimicrobia bacterium]|nr:guanosine monophosphate reductase [Candidatus Neomarinimicrobiota bacterium]